MSFAWFRKHEKMFLWGAIGFSVVILATFSGFGDLQALLRHGAETSVGEFVVASTGETRRVEADEYERVRVALNKLAYTRRQDVTADDVWRHIMLLADARGARLEVTDGQISKQITGGQAVSKEQYRSFWRDQLQFPSAREFENFFRDMLLTQLWQEFAADQAGIVSADDVYLRWRSDNEIFDLDVLVFPDAPLESIADPDAATLQAAWDALAEPVRSVRYVEPSRQDIVYAWLPMQGGADTLPPDKLAAVPEPQPTEVEARWHQVQAERWPDQTELDDATRAVLAREVKLVQYVEEALAAFQEKPKQDAATFTAAMTDAGLHVADPAGLLGPDELKALADLGDENLPLFLSQKSAGESQFGYPYGNQKSVYAAFVEAAQPSRPLTFEEAHDALVKSWKEEQRGQAAQAFRDEITRRTRELPEAAAAIAPLVEEAGRRADEQVAAQPDLDDAGRQALRRTVLDAAEAQDILPRLATFEHLVWADVTVPDGVQRLTLEGVRRSAMRHPDPADDAASIQRFLKSNGAIFQLAVDAISKPLAHAASRSSAIVRVSRRTFPEHTEMPADPEGMNESRRQLVALRRFECSQGFSAEALKASHQLRVVERSQPGKPAPAPPPNAGDF